MRLFISKHARHRFIQRYANLFHKSYFYHDSLTNSLIEQLFKSSVYVNWHKGSNFYRNKVESKYGPTEVYKTIEGGIFFIVRPIDGGLLLRTVVPDFDPRK